MGGVYFHARRVVLSHLLENLLRLQAWRMKRSTQPEAQVQHHPPLNPTTPEDFRPLEHDCFQNPYAFYKMLRTDSPVYQLPNGIYCISRYQDIISVARDHDTFSSTHQGIIAGLRAGEDIERAGLRIAALGEKGLVPSDVLALSDPPAHTGERKIAHKALNARFVKQLDPMVEKLCSEMMDEFIDSGRVEFMQEFGWRLPMRLIIQLLGFPEDDYEKIKEWCVHGIATQSGISSRAELTRSRAASLAFTRYCWRQYLLARKHPREDLSGIFVRSASDPENAMTDQLAVSAIYQLLIAGSDSSATSMGNALKMLIDNPDLMAEVRGDMDTRLPRFVEEVFRLEAAFQGHFRWARKDCEVNGVKLKRGSRLFLMWASANRDETEFENPDEIRLDRKNGKKHLTFGHGIHACVGRELARAEIRIVLREFLMRTKNLRVDGDAPYLASMFARTLVSLPIAFERADDSDQQRTPERSAA